MAIGKSITYKGLSVSGAYIRLDTVSGGKAQGWNGLFNIYANSAQANPSPVKVGERQIGIDAETKEPVMEDVMETPAPEAINSFNVHADFDPSVTPHTALYAAAKQFLGSGCTDV